MRLSSLIKRRILQSGAGFLSNKLHGKSRRDVLYFEDLGAMYISACDRKGFSKDIRDVSFEWGFLTAKSFLPSILTRLPEAVVFGVLLKRAWIHIGIVQDVSISRDGPLLRVSTKGETVTRLIGKNSFLPGFYAGAFSGILGSRVRLVSSIQAKDGAEYVFESTAEPVSISGKSKDAYNKLNFPSGSKGFGLDDALRRNLFQLKEDNHVYFRGKPLTTAENTIFHLLRGKALLVGELHRISYVYFKGLVKADTRPEEALVLLKSLLQGMGWGVVHIRSSGRMVCVEIKNPPYGLQSESDNWGFLANSILGYLRVMDKKLKLKCINSKLRVTRFDYAR